MERTANEIQKERRKEIEDKANELIKKCDVVMLTSINEKGYPRTCVLAIAKAEGFSDVYFITSKRSPINGKVTHFENNPKASVCYFLGGDSVTLIGNIEFVEIEKHRNLFGVSSIEDFSRKELMIQNLDC